MDQHRPLNHAPDRGAPHIAHGHGGARHKDADNREMHRISGHRYERGVWRTSVSCGVFLKLHMITPEDGETELLASMRYDCGDPYAVQLRLHPARCVPVTWWFARETLEAGVRGRGGSRDGCVVARRGVAERRASLFLLLNGTSTHCVLRGPVRAFRALLACSTDLVPYGEESAHIDFAPLTAGWAPSAD